jgi:hypothetical protein
VADSRASTNTTAGRSDTANPRHAGDTLTDAIRLWPTPAARDYKGANSADHLENGTGRKHLDQLPNFVEHMWATPRSSDGEKGSPNQSFGAGGVPLPAQTAHWNPRAWPTPQARDGDPNGRSADPTRVGDPARHGGYNLDDWTAKFSLEVYSLPAPPTETAGEESSHIRRSLNPLFVEWLMGWPPGWTLLGWTDFACSATALSAWKQRMRSALSSLASPPAAPPAQLSLFQ